LGGVVVTRPAFTLLEAILALGILSAAVIVCVGVRGQMLLGTERLREIQRQDRADEGLFQMLINQTIDEPVVDERRGTLVWRGNYLGRPYEVERRGGSFPNPMAGQVGYEVADRVQLVRYVIRYDGRESEVLWHR
jgi:hypothetical protein